MTVRKLDGMAQPTDTKTAVVTIRVPQALRARIQRVTEAEGITIADWTRDALLNAVRRAERRSKDGAE